MFTDIDADRLQLPDRSHIGPGLRGTLFLFRQPFIVWPASLAWIGLLALIAWVSVGNERATWEVVLKLGFDFEGVPLDEYRVNDRFFDMVRMAIRRPTRA